ncbi:MAG: DegT/DnrJ/EryC1/StrS family aminotransferase [Deltaproteobacteria bacterium]|nr:DegT/DnrJ/EryC1/StrS family aminotransferase [Deltaproteobacteria bacterium]
MSLAIKGGKPVRTKPFPAYNSIGQEEKKAVNQVLDSGILSQYLGCWHDNFYGGPQVRTLEKEWAEYFGAKHAVAVNSCTSGLYCAVGATGVEPGEEIIVSSYTMSASAVAPLIYNAIPVFADIEEDYFCLDVKSIEERITPKTRAIIVVDIFGLPCNAEAIQALAKKHNLYVIEDTAQAPGAVYDGKFAGTLGDMGVFSLNYHKHIHCGEGGVIVTDNDELAQRLQLIRNHAEAVVGAKGTENLVNMIGFNFRLGEMEAAIARCQLKKLEGLVAQRQENCEYLSEHIGKIPAITSPKVREKSTHAYYVHAFKFNESIAGVSRDVFIEAVRAELTGTSLREKEGALVLCGYVKPLYLEPLYQNKIAYGSKGYPWSKESVDYKKGLCPVTEKMYEKELFYHQLMTPGMNKNDLDDVIRAFEKVYNNIKELK